MGTPNLPERLRELAKAIQVWDGETPAALLLFEAADALSLIASKTKGSTLPAGWRWLVEGEKMKNGDMLCDPRCEPVEWRGKNFPWDQSWHPVRRKVAKSKVQEPK